MERFRDLRKGMYFEEDSSPLLAPNGNPSNLTREQWELVRTDNFKAWAEGDWERGEGCVLLDKNGEPQIFNHITNFDFTEFDPDRIGTCLDGKGFYFQRGTSPYDGWEYKNMLLVFLKGRKNMDDTVLSKEEAIELIDKMIDRGLFWWVKNQPEKYTEEEIREDRDYLVSLVGGEDDWCLWEPITVGRMHSWLADPEEYLSRELYAEPDDRVSYDMFREMGYDYCDYGGGAVVILDPHNIKSVDNNGDFDPNTANIYR